MQPTLPSAPKWKSASVMYTSRRLAGLALQPMICRIEYVRTYVGCKTSMHVCAGLHTCTCRLCYNVIGYSHLCRPQPVAVHLIHLLENPGCQKLYDHSQPSDKWRTDAASACYPQTCTHIDRNHLHRHTNNCLTHCKWSRVICEWEKMSVVVRSFADLASSAGIDQPNTQRIKMTCITQLLNPHIWTNLPIWSDIHIGRCSFVHKCSKP